MTINCLLLILFEIRLLRFGIYLEFGACDLLLPVYPGQVLSF